jgi:hypothetical protein
MIFVPPSLRRRRRQTAQALLALALLFTHSQGNALQTGQTYYAHGAQTVYSAIMPQPGGSQFYGYVLFYDASTVRDANGDTVGDLEAQAIAMAPRVLHTWKPSLWGFKLTSGAFATLLSAELREGEEEHFDTGPFDFGIEPLYLSRSFGNWHTMFGTSLCFPWGSYDEDSPVNSTLNRFGGSTTVNLTWTPTSRWDISLAWGTEFAGRNRDSQYRDGASTGLTYGIGYRAFADRRWDFGLSGLVTAQLEDDRQSGRIIEDRRTRKFAIGPKVGYWFTPAAAVYLQAQKELEVRNAPKGEYYWLMFSFPLPGGNPAP